MGLKKQWLLLKVFFLFDFGGSNWSFFGRGNDSGFVWDTIKCAGKLLLTFAEENWGNIEVVWI